MPENTKLEQLANKIEEEKKEKKKQKKITILGFSFKL